MPRRLNLPDSASVATTDAQGRLFAPSAARNADAICQVIAGLNLPAGAALELASGTGQHICALARRFRHMTWQASEIDAARRSSITSYMADANLSNIAPVIALDATAAGWGKQQPKARLILLCNLLHLISENEAKTLISEAALALAPGGYLMIYGPFKRDRQLISAGDQTFDASLRAQDPEIGYKNDHHVINCGTAAGLQHRDSIEMPANNLSLIWTKGF